MCYFPSCVCFRSVSIMTKSYEFNWQKHIPDFLQEGSVFDRFDEVHTQTHTHTLTLTHTHSHTYALACTLTLTHTHTYALTPRMHAHTHTHTRTHTHTHTHSLTRTHTQILIRGILGNSAVGVDSSAVC